MMHLVTFAPVARPIKFLLLGLVCILPALWQLTSADRNDGLAPEGEGEIVVPQIQRQTSESITVTWEPPPGKNGLHYQVKCAEGNTLTKTWSLVCSSTPQSICEVSSLQPNTEYVLAVRARKRQSNGSSGAWGPWGPEVQARTLPPSKLDGHQGGPPRAISRTSDSIVLQWNGDAHGIYRIQTYRPGWLYGSWREVSESVVGTSTAVSGLPPQTPFRFRYQRKLPNGKWSLWSKPSAIIYTEAPRPELDNTSGDVAFSPFSWMHFSLWGSIFALIKLAIFSITYFFFIILGSMPAQYLEYQLKKTKGVSADKYYGWLWSLSAPYFFYWLLTTPTSQRLLYFPLSFILWSLFLLVLTFVVRAVG